jgi:hypothetical protein
MYRLRVAGLAGAGHAAKLEKDHSHNHPVADFTGACDAFGVLFD